MERNWVLCTAIVLLVDIEVISTLAYAVFLCCLGVFMAVCAIALFKFSLNEYKKPITGLSERYQKAKNICIARSFFVCTVIQFAGNFIITFCLLLILFVFTPLGMFTTALVLHIVLRFIVWMMSILIPLNFMIWKRNERQGTFKFCSSSSQLSNVYRGVTGKVVPLTVEADEYFRQLKNVWT
uniref:Inner membrane protein n=1 Tax=Panagrellus redivivus TaxID=6233 RepID=A0A7E4VD92_PANRE